ncbi:MAG: hypothetical protein PWR30_315 [Candidatus Woesearchaeota archaeon]|nr:hypothetical protein [Candidatus Woesearchaeota archaeon]
MAFFGDRTGPHPMTWFKGFFFGILFMLLIVLLVKSGIITIPILSDFLTCPPAA